MEQFRQIDPPKWHLNSFWWIISKKVSGTILWLGSCSPSLKWNAYITLAPASKRVKFCQLSGIIFCAVRFYLHFPIWLETCLTAGLLQGWWAITVLCNNYHGPSQMWTTFMVILKSKQLCIMVILKSERAEWQNSVSFFSSSSSTWKSEASLLQPKALHRAVISPER